MIATCEAPSCRDLATVYVRVVAPAADDIPKPTLTLCEEHAATFTAALWQRFRARARVSSI